MAETITASPTRPAPWRDVRVLRVIAQIVAVIVVVLVIRLLRDNFSDNAANAGLRTSFDFLDSPARFQVRDSSFDPDSSIRRLFAQGIKNTAAAAFVGIVLATVIGILVGIGRLSANWVVRKLSTLYVETLRNIPPLVIIAFFGFAVFTFGPFPQFNPANPPGELSLPGMESNLVIYSNSKLGFPSIATNDGAGLFWALLFLALVVAVGVWIWRTRVNTATGQAHHRVLFSLLTLLVLGAAFFVALGGPFSLSFPSVSESGRLIDGGLGTNSGYVSLTLALALYTASHIAEIVRGSILAVPEGQSEAANALALTGFQRYRFIVLPQAARIAIPPTINQYLNLTKNTSLAVVVAYPDVTQLARTAIGNDQPAPQMILVLMAIYLTFSLFISLILNIVNRRVQLAGR